MTNIELKQKINQKLNNLNAEELTLVDNLLSNLNSYFEANKSLLINNKSEEERKKLIHSLRGKYAHLLNSSEDFAKRKQEEIDWESRHK